ncbi:COBRA-like protein 4 [Linum grandiflorum]
MWFCFLLLLVAAFPQTGAYDPLDPHGKIHIKWDIMSWTPDGYVAAVTMTNVQMYRHIASPGWTLGWKWAKKEVIWSMLGAQAADQGDCSKFKGNLPHSCNKSPSIVDLLPGVPKNQKFSHCCKGGILASRGQDDATVSSFQLTVGHSGTSNRSVRLPQDFYLLAPGPGYTCSPASVVSPSVFHSSDGRRRSQALMTWDVVCSYSQMIVSKNPSCCVSLSSFYNPDVTPCPSCACGCQSESKCVKEDAKISSVVQQESNPTSMSKCSDHMCPIKVHWHVKTNYRGYWKVKLSITNLRYRTNYTQWTLVAQHPSLAKIANVSSFLYKPLLVYGPMMNDTGMFYGIKDQNAVLLEAGAEGNVQSEIILQKDTMNSSFTLEHGWAFPLKIYFNGDECVMPSPDTYPFLPSSAHFSAPASAGFLRLILVFFIILLIL